MRIKYERRDLSSLYKKIESDLIAALKSKDKLRLGALRFVKANLDSLLKDKGSALTDEEVIAALKKRMKHYK